jgi:hypothetical protein
MLLAQLRGPFLHYQSGDYHPLAIRAHYGTVILPSIFGARYQLTETSLPWAHHLPDRAAIRRLIDADIPTPTLAWARPASRRRPTIASSWPLIPSSRARRSSITPICKGRSTWRTCCGGQIIFLALYDCPEMVHELLDLITRTYIAWLGRWKAFVGEGNEWTAHWALLMRGGAMIRDDTPVMLSRAQYDEFVKPYDQRILDAFGGCVHFCGRGDHFVPSLATSRNLYGVNSSQPDWNDMALLWRVTREHRLVLLDLQEEYAPAGANQGVTLRRTWQPAS